MTPAWPQLGSRCYCTHPPCVPSLVSELGSLHLQAQCWTLSLRGRAQTISDEQRSDILSGFANLQPHPDIVPALELLQGKGYRTVAFSNSSLNLVTNQITNARLAGHFDHIVSVEETGSFKPDRKVYEYVAACVERPMSDLRLVATHDWDTHGALSAGLLAAYIDRSGAPYHPLYLRPKVFASNMCDVAEQVIRNDAR